MIGLYGGMWIEIKIFRRKNEFENVYCSQLAWEKLNDKKSSRITDRLFDVNITKREKWDKIKGFL